MFLLRQPRVSAMSDGGVTLVAPPQCLTAVYYVVLSCLRPGTFHRVSMPIHGRYMIPWRECPDTCAGRPDTTLQVCQCAPSELEPVPSAWEKKRRPHGGCI